MSHIVVPEPVRLQHQAGLFQKMAFSTASASSGFALSL